MKENGGRTMAIVSYTIEEMRERAKKVDFEYIKNLKDEDIIYDEDSPEITDEMLRHCTVVRYRDGIPTIEKFPDNDNITLDSDVLDFFKSLGDDWKVRLNESLLQIVKFKQILS